MFKVFFLGLSLSAALGTAEKLAIWNQPPEARDKERLLWDEEAAAFATAYHAATGKALLVKPIARDYIQQQFVTVMAGGKGPDVAHVWVGAVATLARQGLLAPLDSEIANWDQRDLIPEALWGPGRVDGHVYGVPMDSYFTTLLIRRDLYVKAGLDPEHPPANWDELAAAARKLTDRSKGVAGFGFAPTADAFMDFVWQAGGDLIVEEQGKARPAFHENAAVTALTFLRDLRFKEGVLQANPLASKDELAQLFAMGKVAMLVGVPNQMPDLIHRYGLKAADLLLAPLPAGPTGQRANHAGGDYFVVSAQSAPAQKAAAWAYVKHVLSPINQLARFRRLQELALPIFPGAFSTTTSLQNLPEFKLVQDALQVARLEPHLDNWPQIRDYLETVVLQRLFVEKNADVEKALGEAARKVQEDLL